MLIKSCEVTARPRTKQWWGRENLVLPPLLESSQSLQMLPCVLQEALSLPTLLVSPEDQASLLWGRGPLQSGVQCCRSPGMFTEFLVRARRCSSFLKTTPQGHSCRFSFAITQAGHTAVQPAGGAWPSSSCPGVSLLVQTQESERG